MKPEQVIELLDKYYPEGAPTESQITNHTVKFRANDWIDNYPSGFEVPDYLNKDDIAEVSRQQLFDQAKLVESSADAMALFVRIMGWGHGATPSRKWQAYRAMNSPDAAEKLLRSFSTIREIGAVETFRRHKRRREYHLDQLGESFFTKWLYFCAYDGWNNETPAPLILDSRVAEALKWTDYRSSGQYREYLELAEVVQQRWAPEHRSHVVEYCLFWIPVMRAKEA